MTDERERWALILGASSGMGEATAITLAKAGYQIAGIHLDFRAALAHVEEVKAAIEAAGSEALYINMNAADDEKRAAALEALRERFERSRAEGREPYVRVVMHSLAFGSLVPFLAEDPKGGGRSQEDGDDPGRHGQQPRLLGPGPVARRVPRAGLEDLRDDVGGLDPGRARRTGSCRRPRQRSSRTSASSRWSSRDSGRARRRTAIRAGVTVTPALLKIPESQTMIDITMKRNPTGRMTTPQDVANAILALSGDGHRVHQRRHHQRRRRRVRHRVVSPPGGAGGRVIVVGSVNVDLVVDGRSTAGARRDGHRRPIRAASRRQGREPGRGRGAAGAATWFVGAVGDDDLGVAAREALAGEGIDVSYLAIVGGAATGVALILVDRAGENSIAVAGGANAALTEAGVRRGAGPTGAGGR